MTGAPTRILSGDKPGSERRGQKLNFLIPERRYDPQDPEMMDRAEVERDLLAGDLRNLRVINKWLGGLRAVRRGVVPLLDRIVPGSRIDVLDLATGSADYPVELAGGLRRLGRSVRITAVDKNPFMIETARKMTADYPEIAVHEMDILSLPFPDRSFDIVLCSSAIHHFSRRDAIHILSDMNRIARVGFVVNDLDRSRVGAWAAWLYGHLRIFSPALRNPALGERWISLGTRLPWLAPRVAGTVIPVRAGASR